MRLQYPSNIRMIKLPCTGKLEVIHLLKALEAGADGVYAAGCLEGECHYLKGNLWAKKRVGYVKKLLEEIGVDPGRVEMYNMSSAMGRSSPRPRATSPRASAAWGPTRCVRATASRPTRSSSARWAPWPCPTTPTPPQAHDRDLRGGRTLKMITAERKPFDEIYAMTEGHDKVLVAGCDTCVAVCLTGGEKEAEILAAQLRIKAKEDGRDVQIEHTAAIRQCEWEYLDAIGAKVEEYPLVLSMACGIGVQSMAEKFSPRLVMPAVNTNMLGMPQEHAVWLERCGACGECVIGETAGICPVVRCSKSLMNGPCGGSHDGKCEVTTPEKEDIECAWALIWERLRAQGREELMLVNRPPKDWSKGSSGGPRKMVREEAKPV